MARAAEPCPAGGILYVNAAVATSGDGTSWPAAYKTLKEALTIAAQCPAVTEIRVASGLYYPTGTQSGTNREESFTLSRSNLKLLGGYSPFDGSRNIAANITILSGDIGTPSVDTDNSYHVLVAANIPATDSLIIEGFTFTKAKATGSGNVTVNTKPFDRGYGGGLYMHTAGPNVAVRSCIFRENAVNGNGGGLFLVTSSPQVSNCVFLNNQAGIEGGGVCAYINASPTISSCVFQLNVAVRGGGLSSYSASSPEVTGCLFTGNAATGDGGGVINTGSSPTFRYCTFTGNQGIYGGAMKNSQASPLIEFCLFRNNTATGGGALYNHDSSNPQLTNCLITGNTAGNGGGGGLMNVWNAKPKVANCTIAGNATTGTGGGINNVTWGLPTVVNSVIYGNSSPSAVGMSEDGPVPPTVFYSLIQQYTGNDDKGNVAFGGNTSDLFADPSAGDYSLKMGSPLLDKGYNGSIPEGITTDLAGGPRILLGVVDLGAYEYNPCPALSATLYVDASVAASGNGAGWPTALKTLREALLLANLCPGVTEIRVAGGTYYPTYTAGTGSRYESFLITRSNLRILGGYKAADGTRNIAANPTILSGDIGTANNHSDNSYHVLTLPGIPATDSLLVEGFTITGGYADSPTFPAGYNSLMLDGGSGAGIYAQNTGANTVIRQCIVQGNVASASGAGFFARSASPTVARCRFEGNTAGARGGGASTTDYASPEFINCLFAANSAGAGGGVNGYSSSGMILTNCTIAGNSAPTGAGVHVVSSAPVIRNSLVYGNTGATDPGLHSETSAPAISYSLIQELTDNSNHNMVFSGVVADVFLNPNGNDYSLKTASPAINAGNNALARGATDLAGNARIQGAVIDLGAYEFEPLSGAVSTLYVNAAIPASGNGATWPAAYKTLKEALDQAQQSSAITEIRIAKGTYYPTGLQTGTERGATFAITRSNLKIVGGYDASTGTRNLVANSTTLSGDIGVAGNKGDNSYHVLVLAAIPQTDSLILDGLTISGGYANAGTDFSVGGEYLFHDSGGGMVIQNAGSNVAIRHCSLTNNEAVFIGGGLYNSFSGALFDDCLFAGNTSPSAGGVYNGNATPVFTRSVIRNNTAGDGAGMYNENSAPSIAESLFDANAASNNGGGMSNYFSLPLVRRSTFTGNTAANGAGMYNTSGSSHTLIHCWLKGNTASNGGGAITNESSVTKLINCVVSGNLASVTGGALDNQGSTVSLINSTVSGNRSAGQGAAQNQGGSLIVRNSVLYANSSGINGTYTLTNSLVDGLSVTTNGNLTGTTFPQFVLTPMPSMAPFTIGDYNLQPCSPLINAGGLDTLGLSLPEVDIAGNPRFSGGRLDIGAYEATSNTPNQTATLTSVARSITATQTAGTTFYANDCQSLVVAVEARGTSPVRGTTTAKVWIDAAQNPQYVKRHYEITPAAGAETATGRLTLYFTQAEFIEFNAVNAVKLPADPTDAAGIANLLIEKRSGISNDGTGAPGSYTGSVQTITPTGVEWNYGASRWEVTVDVTGFSGFFVKTGSGPLPVRWLSFTARLTPQLRAALDWKVEEQNVSHYAIQRSADARNFESVATVKSTGPGMNTYVFTDVQPVSDITYYRIRQIDADGKYTDSKVLSVVAPGGALLKAYPNPVRGSLTVEVAPEYLGSTLSLTTATGIVLQRVAVRERVLAVDVSAYVPGIYLLHTGDGRVVKVTKE